MKFITKAIDRCVLALAVVAGFILLLLLLAVCFATMTRYLFNEPFSNLIDYSSYALIFVAFLGSPWLMGKRGHVNIDLFINMLSPKAQKYWNAVIHFLMVIIAAVVAYVGTALTSNYFITGRVMQDYMSTPQWIVLFPIPLGCLFLALQSLLNGIQDIKEAKSMSGNTTENNAAGGKE
jgi:C4-dicarboxylate transporter DctQ subunit